MGLQSLNIQLQELADRAPCRPGAQFGEIELEQELAGDALCQSRRDSGRLDFVSDLVFDLTARGHRSATHGRLPQPLKERPGCLSRRAGARSDLMAHGRSLLASCARVCPEARNVIDLAMPAFNIWTDTR